VYVSTLIYTSTGKQEMGNLCCLISKFVIHIQKEFVQKLKFLTGKGGNASKNSEAHYYPKYCKSLLM
jgi:hypothetical protein